MKILNSKKGALDIGVGTIVILVIAMVIIGGMVTFLNNFFGEAEGGFGETFRTASEIGLDVNANNPLAFENLIVQSGGESTLSVAVYNTKSTPAYNVTIEIDRCARDGDETDQAPRVFALAQNIEASDDAGFRMSLFGTNSTDDNLPAGTYICNIIAGERASDGTIAVMHRDQITVTVGS